MEGVDVEFRKAYRLQRSAQQSEEAMIEDTADITKLKRRLKATWMTGDFGEIAKSIDSHAQAFIARRGIEPGMRVLDVACGTGNTAVHAARAGATVTGVDIAGNLVEQARTRARREGLDIRLDVGDAEDLPYPAGSFDLVISMYGAMFAPRPDRVAAELVRVCRPEGHIVMANWPPDSFIARMGSVISSHVPPPEGMPPPALWGDASAVRERLREGIARLELTRIDVRFEYPFTVTETVAFYRTYYGPLQRAFAALPEDERPALQRDLEELWARYNRAPDGSTCVETEYLEVDATRA